MRSLTLSLALLAASCSAATPADQNSTPAPTPTPEAVFEPCEAWSPAVPTGTLQDVALEEVSGLAVSRRNEGVLWVMEDSGGPPDVTALDAAGETRLTVHLDGALNTDWEDLALGPCPEGTCVFVGGIGDNAEGRPDCELLRFAEPLLDAAAEPAEITVSPTVMPFTYADGPRDAEALIVLPDGRPVIIDKRSDGPAQVLAFPEPTLAGKPALEVAATLALSDSGDYTLLTKATGADLKAGEGQLAVRTYALLWVFDVRDLPVERWGEAARRFVPAPAEAQGEAVAWGPAGHDLWTISEGEHAAVNRVSCVGR